MLGKYIRKLFRMGLACSLWLYPRSVQEAWWDEVWQGTESQSDLIEPQAIRPWNESWKEMSQSNGKNRIGNDVDWEKILKWYPTNMSIVPLCKNLLGILSGFGLAMFGILMMGRCFRLENLVLMVSLLLGYSIAWFYWRRYYHEKLKRNNGYGLRETNPPSPPLSKKTSQSNGEK